MVEGLKSSDPQSQEDNLETGEESPVVDDVALFEIERVANDFQIQTGETMGNDVVETEPKQLETWLSMEDAISRRFVSRAEGGCSDAILAGARSKGPGYYGRPHWVKGFNDIEYGTIRVDIREYLRIFEEMVTDNTQITRYKDLVDKELFQALVRRKMERDGVHYGVMRKGESSPDFQIAYKRACEGFYSDRFAMLDLIRAIFGINDHCEFMIDYDCSDEEMRQWFDRSVLRDYTEISRDGGGGIYKVFSSDFCDIVPLHRKQKISFQFFGGGQRVTEFLNLVEPSVEDLDKYEHEDIPWMPNHRPEVFPTGTLFDLDQFEELKRVIETLSGNSDVNHITLCPGVGCSIYPTFDKDREE